MLTLRSAGVVRAGSDTGSETQLAGDDLARRRENSVGCGGLIWLTAQLRSQKHEVRHEANRMLLSVAIAGLLPDVFKYLVNRKRPDRALVHGPRHGIGLASTRIMLLAHYASDVVAGLALGAGLGKAVRKFTE